MQNNLTDAFIEEIYALSRHQLTEQQSHQCKRCLLDYLAATLAGSKMLASQNENLISYFSVSGGLASVIGCSTSSSIDFAAFMNGLNAHVAELDDGVITGSVHPGSPVISALLPLAQKQRVSGAALLKAIAIGYEVSVRLAEAIQPSHKHNGYHASATCSAIGAAVAGGVLLDFNKTELKRAFSTAAVSAYGTLKVLEDASDLKAFNVARAAQAAVVAIGMAYSEFGVPVDVLSGKFGFLDMMASEVDLNKLYLGYGADLAIQKVYVKPYAACRYCHPAIDATLKIRDSHSVNSIDIKSIEVYTYELAVAKHDHTQVDSIASAKMSIPFSVAVSFLAGKATINEFDDSWIQKSRLTTLIQKIKIFVDPDFTKKFPRTSGARVVLETMSGEKFCAEVDYPKGEPETKLTDNEIEQKFISMSQFAGKSESEAKAIAEIVWNAEHQLNDLYAHL